MKILCAHWAVAITLGLSAVVSVNDVQAAKDYSYLYLTDFLPSASRYKLTARNIQTGKETVAIDWSDGFGITLGAPRELQLFNHRAEGESSSHLYSLSYKKNKRVRLSGNMVPGGNVNAYYSTNRNKVVFYRADQETDNKYEYYVTKTKKSKPVKLNLTSDASLSPIFAPAPLHSGKGLVFRAYQGSGNYDLYLSMLKEPLPRQISEEPANPDATVNLMLSTNRGKGVVYRTDFHTPNVFEFFYHDVKKRVTFPLNFSPAPRTIPSGMRLDSRDKYFYYPADQEVAGKFELYRTNLKTGEIQKISPEMPDHCSIGPDLSLAPKDTRMYYSTNNTSDGTRELHALDLKTLVSTRVTDEGVSITASCVDNAGNIYYQLDEPGVSGNQYYRKDAVTGAVTPLLHPDIPTGEFITFHVEKNGAGVLLRIVADNEELTDFYYQDIKTGEYEFLTRNNVMMSDPCVLIRSWF